MTQFSDFNRSISAFYSTIDRACCYIAAIIFDPPMDEAKAQLLQRLNNMNPNTLMETLGITFTDAGAEYLEATMPVLPRVHQPFGLLHGGANVALAESVGSCGSQMVLNDPGVGVVGLEINANHLRSKKDGVVTARGTLVHKGRRTHVWEIRITDEAGKLLSICRMTNMILDTV